MATTTQAPSEAIAVPFININGTSKNSLLEENRKARHAISDAHEALSEAGPHPRDYQGQEAAYQLARRQHVARLDDLVRIGKELDAIAEHIDAHGSR